MQPQADSQSQATARAPLPPRPVGAAPLAGLLALLCAGAAAVIVSPDRPELALAAAPSIVAGAAFAARWPVATVVGLFGVIGFNGTFLSFTSVGPFGLAQGLLACLWLGVLATFLVGRSRPLWLWPGLIAGALYVILTAVQVPFTDPVELGLLSFRTMAWWMSAVILVAVAPWPEGSVSRIARWVSVVALAVGSYAVFRWIVGPAPEEEALARITRPDTFEENLRVYGSFPSAPNLTAWGATMTPFMLALALGWRGRWRWIALTATTLVGLAVLASNTRAGFVALLVGIASVMLLYQLAQAFPGGNRLATALAAMLAILVVGVGGYALAIGSDDIQAERYANLLSLSEDRTYNARLDRWDLALEDMSDHPFGRGLGTVGTAAKRENPFGEAVTPNLDSSYLKVGVEQGPFVMAFFGLALVAFLVGLALRTVATRDRSRAALGLGACGSLAALMTLFYAGVYSETIEALGAWLLIGLGASQFTSPPATPPPPSDDEAGKPAPLRFARSGA